MSKHAVITQPRKAQQGNYKMSWHRAQAAMSLSGVDLAAVICAVYKNNIFSAIPLAASYQSLHCCLATSIDFCQITRTRLALAQIYLSRKARDFPTPGEDKISVWLRASSLVLLHVHYGLENGCRRTQAGTTSWLVTCVRPWFNTHIGRLD